MNVKLLVLLYLYDFVTVSIRYLQLQNHKYTIHICTGNKDSGTVLQCQ